MRPWLCVIVLLGCPLALSVLTGCTIANSSGQTAEKQSSVKGAEPLSPTQVMKKYYALVSQGKLEEAQKYRLTKFEPGPLAAPADAGSSAAVLPGAMELPPDNLEKFFYETKAELREVLSETVEENKAEVTAILRSGIGRQTTAIHRLYRQDGEWKFFLDVRADGRLCTLEPAACHIVLTPAAAVNWYYHYAAEGEVEKSREYLATQPDSDSGQAWPDAFGPGAETTFGKRGITFGALESEVINGDTAVVRALVLFEEKPIPVRHHLSKESGTWKILSYSKS